MRCLTLVFRHSVAYASKCQNICCPTTTKCIYIYSQFRMNLIRTLTEVARKNIFRFPNASFTRHAVTHEIRHTLQHAFVCVNKVGSHPIQFVWIISSSCDTMPLLGNKFYTGTVCVVATTMSLWNVSRLSLLKGYQHTHTRTTCEFPHPSHLSTHKLRMKKSNPVRKICMYFVCVSLLRSQ